MTPELAPTPARPALTRLGERPRRCRNCRHKHFYVRLSDGYQTWRFCDGDNCGCDCLVRYGPDELEDMLDALEAAP